MKKFLEEFKKFLDKGNALEMAIGVVMGGAFTSIVNSLVGDIITPIIGKLVGGLDFTGIMINLGGDANIMIGNFIQAVFNFVIIALALFFIIKGFNKINELKDKKKEAEEAAPAEDPADIKLLKSIEAELKKLNSK